MVPEIIIFPEKQLSKEYETGRVWVLVIAALNQDFFNRSLTVHNDDWYFAAARKHLHQPDHDMFDHEAGVEVLGVNPKGYCAAAAPDFEVEFRFLHAWDHGVTYQREYWKKQGMQFFLEKPFR